MAHRVPRRDSAGRYHTSSHANAYQRVSKAARINHTSHPDDATQEWGEAAKHGFQSVVTAHAQTFPNSVPTAQTGTFSGARPLKIRKKRKGLRT